MGAQNDQATCLKSHSWTKCDSQKSVPLKGYGPDQVPPGEVTLPPLLRMSVPSSCVICTPKSTVPEQAYGTWSESALVPSASSMMNALASGSTWSSWDVKISKREVMTETAQDGLWNISINYKYHGQRLQSASDRNVVPWCVNTSSKKYSGLSFHWGSSGLSSANLVALPQDFLGLSSSQSARGSPRCSSLITRCHQF